LVGLEILSEFNFLLVLGLSYIGAPSPINPNEKKNASFRPGTYAFYEPS